MVTERQQKILWLVIAFAAIAFALWLFNPFNLYFLNDDLIHIPLSKDGVLFQHKSMRPVCDLSVQLDYLIWGKTAWGYHLTNLLLHIANTILVYFLTKEWLKKLAAENIRLISSATALLFFVYGFHSETIFWILGRSASLGALFFIPALIFYLKRNESSKFLAASILFFLVGLLTYESVWIFPVIAGLVSLSDQSKTKNTRKELFSISLLVLCFIGYAITRLLVLGEIVGSYEGSAFLQVDVVRMAIAFFKLFFRLFVPPAQSSIVFIGGAVSFLLVIGAVFILFRKRKLNGQGILLFFACVIISLFPYLSLGIDTHTVEGERYLYLPSVFAGLLLVSLIFRIFEQKKWQLSMVVFLLGFNLYHLTKAANNYKMASRISSATFEEINALKGKKQLFIDSLPQSVNGALVFRLGFEEGVKWLKNPGTVDSVYVLSIKKDNTVWSKNFNSKQGNSSPVNSIQSVLVKASDNQNEYEEKAVLIQFNPLTDARFIYGVNGLSVIK